MRKVAENLQVSASTLTRLLNGESNISPEMALRLSKSLGRSPESWLAMQDQYDLWHARKKSICEKYGNYIFLLLELIMVKDDEHGCSGTVADT